MRLDRDQEFVRCSECICGEEAEPGWAVDDDVLPRQRGCGERCMQAQGRLGHRREPLLGDDHPRGGGSDLEARYCGRADRAIEPVSANKRLEERTAAVSDAEPP